MRKGYSGAMVSVLDGRVVRKTGTAIDAQGRYCTELGARVCPNILNVREDEYTMELLGEPDIADENLLHEYVREVRLLLRREVWNRRLFDREQFTPRSTLSWKTLLCEWSAMVETLLGDLYRDNERDRFCMIHGDPTLANLLYTEDGFARLCDPIRPVGKIPPLPEVDAGKLLQSVAGWEHVACGWPSLFHDPGYAESAARIVVGELNERRCHFWLMVHLLRIVPYARDPSSTHVLRWAEHGSLVAYNDLLKERPLCDTLSTLTELSRTLAKPSA